MKRSKICLITTPEGKPKENGKQVIFEGVTATSPDLLKSINPTKYIPSWIKKSTN